MTYKLNIEKLKNKICPSIAELLKSVQYSGAVLIATNTDIIFEKNFGDADISKKISVTHETQFLAGSVTKQFTTVALLKALLDKNIKASNQTMLNDQIQTELNNTIEHYLPAKHPIWNDKMPAWAKCITLHQLLVHSSGIINYTSLADFEKQKFSKSSDLVSFFKDYELEFKAGEKFSYSNSGYYLLGIIIEEIAQQKLDDYLEKTFFVPLGMRSTFLPMHGTADDLIRSDTRFANLARGYEYESTQPHANLEEIKRYESMNVPGAAGSLISTAADLLKWNTALYDEKILPPFLLAIILKPYLMTELSDAYYGYGIEIIKSNVFGEYYSHRGGIPGYRSVLTFIPTLNLSIVILQNITANQEKLIPEVEKIKANLPANLSPEESLEELIKVIENKYPSFTENRKRYELTPVHDEIIKILASFAP